MPLMLRLRALLFILLFHFSRRSLNEYLCADPSCTIPISSAVAKCNHVCPGDDATCLPFEQDDEIQILSKSSSSNLWKGQIGEKTGFFDRSKVVEKSIHYFELVTASESADYLQTSEEPVQTQITSDEVAAEVYSDAGSTSKTVDIDVSEATVTIDETQLQEDTRVEPDQSLSAAGSRSKTTEEIISKPTITEIGVDVGPESDLKVQKEDATVLSNELKMTADPGSPDIRAQEAYENANIVSKTTSGDISPPTPKKVESAFQDDLKTARSIVHSAQSTSMNTERINPADQSDFVKSDVWKESAKLEGIRRADEKGVSISVESSTNAMDLDFVPVRDRFNSQSSDTNLPGDASTNKNAMEMPNENEVDTKMHDYSPAYFLAIRNHFETLFESLPEPWRALVHSFIIPAFFYSFVIAFIVGAKRRNEALIKCLNRCEQDVLVKSENCLSHEREILALRKKLTELQDELLRVEQYNEKADAKASEQMAMDLRCSNESLKAMKIHCSSTEKNLSDCESQIAVLHEELESMRLTEKMCSNRMQDYENTIGKLSVTIENMQEEISNLKAENCNLKSDLANAEGNIKATRISLLEKDDHVNELNLKISSLIKEKEECEEKLLSLSYQWDGFRPLFKDIDLLIDHMNKFSLTRIDSLLMDPLDTNFIDFLKVYDNLKLKYKAESLSEEFERIGMESKVRVDKIKAELGKALIVNNELENKIKQQAENISSLEIRLSVIDEMRHKDNTSQIREIAELKKTLEEKLSENSNLLKLEPEFLSKSSEVLTLKKELETIKGNYSKLLFSKENLITELELTVQSLQDERDRLNNTNEILRRKFIEMDRNSRNIRPEAFASKRTPSSTPDSLNSAFQSKDVSPRSSHVTNQICSDGISRENSAPSGLRIQDEMRCSSVPVAQLGVSSPTNEGPPVHPGMRHPFPPSFVPGFHPMMNNPRMPPDARIPFPYMPPQMQPNALRQPDPRYPFFYPIRPLPVYPYPNIYPPNQNELESSSSGSESSGGSEIEEDP